MTVERWTDEMLAQIAVTLQEASRISKEASITAKENTEAIRQLREDVKENTEAIRELREESKEQGIRFATYQQASQWVVNLAFGLLATATVTTIVTVVFRR